MMESLSINGNNTLKSDLAALNYRQLQSKAKELGLPGNLKHNVLVEVIKARWSGDESQVTSILHAEKDTRARKKASKKSLEYSKGSNGIMPFSPLPRVKRVGRPRKKSLNDSYTPYIENQTPELDYRPKRSLRMAPETPTSSQSTDIPMAHSIQQLLMDKSVPNANNRHQYGTASSASHTHRYTFKTVHRSLKGTSGRQGGSDTFNRPARKSWDSGSYTTSSCVLPQQNGGCDYSSFNNSHLSYDKPFQVEDVDPTATDYLPDLAGLLGSSTPLAPQSHNCSSIQPPSSSSQYPSIFIRQDLVPTYQDNNANTTYQQMLPHTQYHDYNWPGVWNYSTYLPNPTGYSEEVIISETQNSDTLSATENADLLPLPNTYTSTLLPENDNQIYWPKVGLNATGPATASTYTSPTTMSTSSNNTAAEKGGLSHMRVSVVDTQEWTYEYSTSSGLFTQPFLQHI